MYVIVRVVVILHEYRKCIFNLILQVFSAEELNSKKRPETAASQFKTSLARLVEILMSKEPSYIRCIKPNETKKPGSFDTAIVTHQVDKKFPLSLCAI